ncbi:MarR family winged helix-turn-helix transcriptional regulator [Orientia tsutsugamushi]|uniref:MarR family winged helix-turn-helix transcriptional regulator n=1 Tax=Orientia tsutsugamushi TaxID=784 RepID=UPI0035273171
MIKLFFKNNPFYGEKYMSYNATKDYPIPVLESPSFTFAQAYFTWKRITDRALDAVSLTHTQYVFMGTLFELEKHQDKATQNDLAKLTNSDVAMTSQILRTLQKRGLVLREQIEGDERTKYSSLSPAGKKLVKKAAEIMKTNEKEYFAPVEKDMEQFLTYLKVLTRVKEINLL